MKYGCVLAPNDRDWSWGAGRRHSLIVIKTGFGAARGIHHRGTVRRREGCDMPQRMPVYRIHPTKDQADLESVRKLYIDPAVCVDCGACVPVCPVEAIYAEHYSKVGGETETVHAH